jgi:murein DD-endopeptidase MepM/ murein hydrolase activator NlpD
MKNYLLTAVIALLAGSICVVLWLYDSLKEIKELSGNETTLLRPKPERGETIVRYGMNLTGCQLLTCSVQPNEIITDIFAKHRIATSLAHSLVQESKEIFNPKKIRAGNPYTVVLQHTDSGIITKKIIYEEDKVNFVVFNFGDTNYIYRGKHPVERKTREVSGVIKNSLYETLDAQHLPSVLAVQMAEIFSCVIDFYRIQSNDYFKVIYEEDFVEGQSVGIGKIYACVFSHAGKEYKAFYFQRNEGQPGEFYDEKGESMKRQFLKAPLKFFRISSRYSTARLHPVTKVVKAHLGTDYAAPHGTPIMATAEGVVEEAQFKVHNGNYVKIRHNGQYKTQYLHMCKFAPGIKTGKKVKQGEIIGYVGSTGLASGPHVCYRFWRDGKQVDPLKQKISFSEPLPASHRAEFFKSIEALQQKLDSLPILPHETSVTAYVSSSQNLRKSR